MDVRFQLIEKIKMNSSNKQESVALIFINDKPICMTMPELKQWFKTEVDKIKQDKEQAK